MRQIIKYCESSVLQRLSTADGNSFAEMSSWTALTWYTVMKTAFKPKNMKKQISWDFYRKDF